MNIFSAMDTAGRLRTLESFSSKQLLGLAAALLVLVALIFWGASVMYGGRGKHRKHRHRQHKHHRRHSSSDKVEASEETPAETTEQNQQHSRRRHREYRSRNPTLAETGGLPPKREDGSSPPIARTE